MNRQQLRELIVASIAIPVLYAGFYYGMLEPWLPKIVPWSSGRLWYRSLIYRWNSPTVHILLEPMHRFDRVIRPEFWDEQGEVLLEDPYERQNAMDDIIAPPLSGPPHTPPLPGAM